jgi:predicted transcriptional regulator
VPALSAAIAKARSALCYLAVRKLGITAVTISKELGISPSAVSKAIVREQREMQCDHIELLESQ